MEPLFPLLIVLGIGISVAASLAGADSWKKAAAELGLAYSSGFQRQIKGTIDGFFIVITQQKNQIDVCLSSEGAIRGTVSLSAENILSGVLGGRDIEIGCPVFDSTTHISSSARDSEVEVAALLDEKARRAVSSVVVTAGAKVARGEITYQKTNSISEIPSMVRRMVDLARQLSMRSHEIPARLAANARNDSVSAVRLHNLTLLQQRYRRSDEALETSAKLLDHTHPSIRLAAAMFFDAGKLEVVRDIALNQRLVADVRVKALEHLAGREERTNMVEIAGSLLGDRSKLLRRMAIQILGRLKHLPSLNAITAHLNPADVATSLEIIDAIVNIGDPSAEGVLIDLLNDGPNRVRSAAIEALGKIGTVAAVEPLLPLSKQMRFRRVARAAIDSIQSRLGDVESGRLSLAPASETGGGLSLAGDPQKAGGLSLDQA